MLPPIFYAPTESLVDDIITLPPDESRHAAQVLRLPVGSLVMVVDGLGSAWRGELKSVSARRTTIAVHNHRRNFGEPSVRLTLAVGLSSATKLDTIIQKGTELGVIRFVPIVTEKSKVKLESPARARTKVSRLERVALAAIKQCRRAYRPEIATPVPMTEFLTSVDKESVNLVFHPGNGFTAVSDLELPEDARRVTALVGPEAGFSDNEAELALAAGFTGVQLGERMLRAETAGPVICALLMDKLGEFR
ncbi:RsmE family RNA methyltransferase [candidate division GN15 bacterium]|nr:RsmE family RNA methyltransferase [candidate division GN15 bacterium]